ncbi:AI-2E family transporter [Sphingomonas immobilis]|uniref:AI-2E family transporter n=1 Tax=Sphingomonas immobilis TaxID=3063997 RepID=A0ABT9A1I3_9SPHN|nr:AI-2E family transporter [Sphingomonas sp. CA1-15]MDO7843683.1 AI-2E family transporter [Sphingomonas sp. CA1-15]
MDEADPARARARLIGKVVLVTALALFGLWIVSGFVPAFLWAVVIAVALDPLQQRFLGPGRSARARTIFAAVATLAVALLVLIPLALFVAEAAREAHDLLRWMAIARTNGVPVPAWVHTLPFGADATTKWWQENLATPEAATLHIHQLQSAQWFAQTRLIGSNVLHRAVIFGFTLLTLFFLLRDRDAILAQAHNAGDRLLGPAGERIAVQALLSIRGTIDGLVLVGIGVGAVMAAVYAVLGVPHPLLLGALTAIAAMIPFGAALMFAIAALLLLAGPGGVTAAIAVIVIGLVVIFIADHFIRPALIGGATQLPFLWVLIGILGGVETFGLLGLFLGPATMAVLILLWRDFLAKSPPA